MKDLQFAKVVVFINGLVPAAIMAWDFANKQTGANPVNYLIHTSGVLTFVFLLLSLSMTPLRRLTGKNFWSAFRRMLGLYAFFYAAMHFSFYFVLDRAWSVRRLVSEIVTNQFILFGVVALGMMVPLALTSTAGSVKRMGARQWKRLHMLVYVSVIAASLHFLSFGKVRTTESVVFAALGAGLLLFRLAAWLVGRNRSKATRRDEPALTAK